MADLCKSIKFNINTLLGYYPESKKLANDSYGLIYTFISEYGSWFTNFYLELKMMGDSLEEESWELMTHCGKCLFEEMCHMYNMV